MSINTTKEKRILIAGGGAAGYFAAIACAEANSRTEIIICEAAKSPLAKVRISGGGRCNVTYNCFDPAEFVKGYPRGAKELRGPFSRFHAGDTVAWFEKRGVKLKIEDDGRIFPKTDDSGTITDCLENATKKAGVKVWCQAKVKTIESVTGPDNRPYLVRLGENCLEYFDQLLLATGSGAPGYKLATSLGHTLAKPVPSLFSFNIRDARIANLSGISLADCSLELTIAGQAVFRERGPLLITHWGLSGPAIIRLSAWAARELSEVNYKAALKIAWLGQETQQSVIEKLKSLKQREARRLVSADKGLGLPHRFWGRLVEMAQVPADAVWATISNKTIESLAAHITKAEFEINGRGVFKDEFATCGGVKLSEVNFKTMQSKILPGLYLAGEILDIDGITGGFNLQSAWTTGWIAGNAMAAG